MADSNKTTWHWWLLGGLGTAFLFSYLNRKRVMENLSENQLTKNFNLSEFIVTATGLDNLPGPKETENLRLLAQKILQPLRDFLGKPISINSAYRSPIVNAAIGGASTSQHMVGQAADIHIDGLTNQQIVDAIKRLGLPYDQLIDEQLRGKKWVHVSFNPNGGRKQLMTARDGAGGKTIYTTISKG